MKDDGGPAFPVPPDQVSTIGDSQDGMAVCAAGTGMTLRDWFAGMALQGDLAGQSVEVGYYTGPTWQIDAARNAYLVADAMLAARKEN